MQITSFNQSIDSTKFELTISDAAAVTILRLWNDKTYKNFAKVIDLSAKLNSTATQNIEITLSDIGEPYFDGVYFIEAKDNDETSTAITAELGRFKECIMDKLIALKECDECLEEKNSDLINSHMALRSLEDAILLKFPNEIINIKRSLDKYCSNACRSCGDFTNVTTTASKDTLNPDTILISIDGGNLD